MQYRNALKAVIIFFFVLTIFYLSYSVFRIVTSFAPDFSVYYGAARSLVLGKNMYDDQALYTGVGYPPLSILFYIPLSFLPFRIAQGIWVVGSFLSIFISVYLTLFLYRKSVLWQEFFIVASLALLSFPFKFTLGMGQVNIVILFLLVLSVIFLTKRRNTIYSVLCLFFMCSLKPQMIVLLPIFLLYGHIREILWIGILIAFGVVMSGILFGWQLYSDYIFGGVPQLLTFQGPEVYYNQGIAAIVSRFIGSYSFIRPVWIALSFLLYAWVIGFLKKRRVPLIGGVAIALPVLLLIEPLSWQHHYILLLPSFVYFWKYSKTLWSKILFFICLFSISVNIPNPALFIGNIWGSIILSHVGLGTFVFLLYNLYIQRTKPI